MHKFTSLHCRGTRLIELNWHKLAICIPCCTRSKKVLKFKRGVEITTKSKETSS